MFNADRQRDKWTDGRTDMTKLIAALSYFANGLKAERGLNPRHIFQQSVQNSYPLDGTLKPRHQNTQNCSHFYFKIV